MKTSLNPDTIRSFGSQLKAVNDSQALLYPGNSGARQPVHTVYGGAHLFKSDTTRRLGELALRSLSQYGENSAEFWKAIQTVEDTSADAEFAETIYQRVVSKLEREPVEDFRIDFEDGYGNRPDSEEDGHAESAAIEVAKG